MTTKDSKQTINSIINHWFKVANDLSQNSHDGDWTDANKDTMISIAKHWEDIAKRPEVK